MFFLSALVFLFFLQQQRIFSIDEINPNFILVGLLSIASLRIFSFGRLLLFLFLIFIAVSFLGGHFWILETALAAALAFLAYVVSRYLTGNIWIDFPAILIGGQLIFYFGRNLSWSVFLYELAYNFVIGLIFILPLLYEKRAS